MNLGGLGVAGTPVAVAEFNILAYTIPILISVALLPPMASPRP